MAQASFVDTHDRRDAFVANMLDRLVGRIVEQGDELLRHAGVVIPSRSSSILLLLGEARNLSAADLARLLDQPHQLVTQRTDLLIALGVVARVDDRRDARRKVLRLTAKGRRELGKLNAVLVDAQEAISALYREIGCDLFDAAARAMDALDRAPLQQRIEARPHARRESL
jgi:DNA-binding MarR family transcriptional regulator